jgi:hypothetical protein
VNGLSFSQLNRLCQMFQTSFQVFRPNTTDSQCIM